MLHLYYLLEYFSEKQITKSSIDSFWKKRAKYGFERTFITLTAIPLIFIIYIKALSSGIAEGIPRNHRTWVFLLFTLSTVILSFGLCLLLRKKTTNLKTKKVNPSKFKAFSFLLIYYLILTIITRTNFSEKEHFRYRFEQIENEVIMKKDTTWRYYYDKYLTQD